jgi:hypothetical protein
MDILQLVTFEYVEGREMNRLIGIHEKEKFENLFVGEKLLEKRRVVSNIVNFILRTVVGETQNEKLWESFLQGIQLLNNDPRGLYHVLEVIWLIKILVALGYWEEGRNDEFSSENLDYLAVEENRELIVEDINRAIKSTHL